MKRDLLARKHLSDAHAKGNNAFVVRDGVVYVSLNNSPHPMLCDVEDWERLKKHTWFEHRGYVHGKIMGKEVRFHRYILDAPKGYEVDHINRNTFDNRKENLRIISHKGNMINTGLSRNNKTGCKGVYKYPRGYLAQINVNGKRIYLGAYKTFEEAVKARRNAEEKLHKPFLEKETLHTEVFF